MTDRRTDPTHCFTFLAIAAIVVGKYCSQEVQHIYGTISTDVQLTEVHDIEAGKLHDDVSGWW